MNEKMARADGRRPDEMTLADLLAYLRQLAQEHGLNYDEFVWRYLAQE